MPRVHPVRLAMVWSITLVASVAAAEPKGYLQAGLMATAQPAGVPNHRVTPPISGTTVGVAAAVGFFVTPTVAIEGEVVAGKAISTPQHFYYDWTEDYTARAVTCSWAPTCDGVRPPHATSNSSAEAVWRSARLPKRSIVRTELPFPGEARRATSEPDRRRHRRPARGQRRHRRAAAGESEDRNRPAFTIRWVGRSASGPGRLCGVGSYAYQFGATVRLLRLRRDSPDRRA